MLRALRLVAAALVPAVVCLTSSGSPRLAAEQAPPAPVMHYRHNAPESALDQRYRYHWTILETALEKTAAKYGPYVLDEAEPMTEARQRFELTHPSSKLNVMYLGTTPEMERDLVPVRIPVDRNLGGYCVFLIRRDRQSEFDAVRTRADLSRFTFGLGLGWIDVEILRANQLQVVTGSSYDGLFEMTENRRFDIFLRAAVEVLDEFDSRKASMPDLAIERGLSLYYPMPMYFWFAPTAEGRRLAARAEDGMRQMIADGSYARIFSQYQDAKIQRLDLARRRIIEIANPLLGPLTPFADLRLWFNPRTYRPGRQ